MQYAVDAVHSGIVVYDCGNIVFDTKKVKLVDAVHSGPVHMAVGKSVNIRAILGYNGKLPT